MTDEAAGPPPSNRWRSCAIAGCVILSVLAFVPPVVLWSVTRDWDEPLGPARHVRREHALPALPPGGSGRVILDVAMSEVEVEIGAPGSPLRIDAEWQPERFRFDEQLRPEGNGWSYRVSLRGRGLRTWGPRRGHLHGPRLRLRLPPDRPLSLEGQMGLASTRLELGGATLSKLDLELGAGEHRLSFAQPLREPLDSLRLHSSMGEIDVATAGNASPRELRIEQGMGELTLDLAGLWRRDGRVDLRLGMGDCRVQLPADSEAGAVVEDTSLGMGSRHVEDRVESELPPGLPRVRITAHGGMGELDIR